MFIIHVKVNIGEISEKYHPEHTKFLNKQFEDNIFLMFGRSVTREASGTIIAHSESKEKLMEIFKQDPYFKYGCATLEIEEFTPARIAENISDFK